MPKYLIERNIPGASTLSAKELQEISAKSNEVIGDLGEPYTWVTSFVAGDKIFCVHEAESEDAVRRHAQAGGFPVDAIAEVAATIDPSTGHGA